MIIANSEIPIFGYSRDPGILVPKLYFYEFIWKSYDGSFDKRYFLHLQFSEMTHKILKVDGWLVCAARRRNGSSVFPYPSNAEIMHKCLI